MSTGAGRVEQAIRDYIAEHHGHRNLRIVHPDALFVAAFGRPPWTRAQRGSVLRAMHRIIAGQPGWQVYSPEGKRGVVFEFTPPGGTPKSKLVPAAHLVSRPQSQRQITQEKREKRLARERAKQPVVLSYFFTGGKDTLDDEVADLFGLPRGCKVVTRPETIPPPQPPEVVAARARERELSEDMFLELVKNAHLERIGRKADWSRHNALRAELSLLLAATLPRAAPLRLPPKGDTESA
jgi:hypothetical protein